MKRLALALALAITLAGCVPFAQFARDLMDSSDGATLTYVLRTPTTDPGLRFDPDGRLALGVVLTATGANLTLLSAPEGACTLNEARANLDCRLGDVLDAVTVHLTGASVLANASYRREGSTVPLITFAR
jgi:hypothetical protein